GRPATSAVFPRPRCRSALAFRPDLEARPSLWLPDRLWSRLCRAALGRRIIALEAVRRFDAGVLSNTGFPFFVHRTLGSRRRSAQTDIRSASAQAAVQCWHI